MKMPEQITDTLDNFAALFQAVIWERRRQYQKWGQQSHSPAVWAVILGEEKGEVDRAVLEHDGETLREELIQVAAVALAVASGLPEPKMIPCG